MCEHTCASPSARRGRLSARRQSLTALVEIAIPRGVEVSSFKAGLPLERHGRHLVRFAGFMPLTAPSTQANHSPQATVEVALWIGAAVLSGMLGNFAYELVKRGVRRIIAKLHRGRRKKL